MVVCTFLFIGLGCFAQSNLDSLWSVWQDDGQADSTRVKAYREYIWKGYLFSKPDSASILIQDLHEYARNQDYQLAAAVAYRLEGVKQSFNRNYELGLEYFEKSLAISERLDDKKGQTKTLNNIGNVYQGQGQYEEAIDHYEQSLAIKRELCDDRGIAVSLNNLGLVLESQGDYSDAYLNYKEALLLCRKIDDKKLIAYTLTNLGNIYQLHSNYAKALAHYIESLHISEELNDTRSIAANLGNIGNIYKHTGEIDKSLEYYNKSLQLGEETKDQKGIARILINIGQIHCNRDDYPNALDHFNRSLELSESMNQKMLIASNLANIGNIYKKQENYTKSLDYYNRSLNFYKESGNKRGISSTLNNLGLIYLELSDYPKALTSCKEGYELSKSTGVLRNQKTSCECLYNVYKDLGNNKKALVFLEELKVINDSLHFDETTKELQRMEFAQQVYRDSVETAEKERMMVEAHKLEVEEKNKLNEIYRNIGILAALAALSLWSGLHFVRKSRNRIARERKKSDTLLLNILPEEIANELKHTGKAKPRKYEGVTILFTDFLDFTKTAEKLSPDDLVEEINACYKAFDRIVANHGIEKIKTIGDAYMAADGFAKSDIHAAKNVVLAALDIEVFMLDRQQKHKELNIPAFQIRAGIHTGDVVAGVVGEKKFQFDIWGDAVNTASRMETNSENGKVNISNVTYQLIKDDPLFTFESRGKIAVKGKGEMEMWFVSKA